MKKHPREATAFLTEEFSQLRVKDDGESMAGHRWHHFKVKFRHTDKLEYTIYCDHPCTVLEAIKSTEKYNKTMTCPDENIVIQLSKQDKKYIVPTHFPCSCISEDESLILSCESKIVEEAQDQLDETIQPRGKYSVFYIDTIGGLNTKKKSLFRNNAVKKFKYLCVYGEKGTTVEEALRRDGRFMFDFSNFSLSDNDNSSQRTERTQKVDNLDGKEFKICLPRKKREPQSDIKPFKDIVKQRGISVRAAMKERDSNVSDEEISELLRRQFSSLKDWMERRFTGDYYEKALKKADFGKIQRLFSEVHRVREMINLGQSVCKVVVRNVCQGTGFVLFDNYILTNAHILKDCVMGQMLKPDIDVDVFFNYEDSESHTNYTYFQAQRVVYCSEGDLDYAILELNPEGQVQSMQTNKIPPGLLKRFGKPPSTGEACLIGHPAGEVKKIDLTCIIEKEEREQVVGERFIVHLINSLHEQGIDSIISGERADKVSTYSTFMYHGASGSPVFDVHGNVFGLHTAGYVYGYPFATESVIEYAQPVLAIFEHFVRVMTERGNMQSLLQRAGEEAKGNQLLEKVFKSVVKGRKYEALLRSIDAVKEEAAESDESDESDDTDDTFYVRYN